MEGSEGKPLQTALQKQLRKNLMVIPANAGYGWKSREIHSF